MINEPFGIKYPAASLSSVATWGRAVEKEEKDRAAKRVSRYIRSGTTENHRRTSKIRALIYGRWFL